MTAVIKDVAVKLNVEKLDVTNEGDRVIDDHRAMDLWTSVTRHPKSCMRIAPLLARHTSRMSAIDLGSGGRAATSLGPKRARGLNRSRGRERYRAELHCCIDVVRRPV
jgi:hypothetical protein